MSRDVRRALMAAIDDVLASPLSEAAQEDVLRQAGHRISILLRVAPLAPAHDPARPQAGDDR